MKFFLGFLIATIIWVGVLAAIPMPEERVRIYDCGMAEWHPDIPADVKEACRKRFKNMQPGPTT
jgi:hypothetical protein